MKEHERDSQSIEIHKLLYKDRQKPHMNMEALTKVHPHLATQLDKARAAKNYLSILLEKSLVNLDDNSKFFRI